MWSKSKDKIKIVFNPRRQLFSSLFGKKRVGGCEKQEQVFRKFQETITDHASRIEQIVSDKNTSTRFVLNSLMNIQKTQMPYNKFFFDAFMDKIDERLETIVSSKDLV
jgi:hypothetical protein